MALAKTGYRDAQQLTTKVSVNIDERGNIATDPDDSVGAKNYTINRANAANGLTENNQLFNFFIGMLGGTIITNSNTATVKWQV